MFGGELDGKLITDILDRHPILRSLTFYQTLLQLTAHHANLLKGLTYLINRFSP